VKNRSFLKKRIRAFFPAIAADQLESNQRTATIIPEIFRLFPKQFVVIASLARGSQHSRMLFRRPIRINPQ